MRVLVFRHQLFRISEPFIVQQAQEFRRHKAVYAGRSRDNAGPDGVESIAMEDLPGGGVLRRKVWQAVTRDPKPYLQLLGDTQPALIHAHFGVEGVYALPLARRLNVPLVTTFHGFDATTSMGALFQSGSPSWVNYALLRRRLAKEGRLFLCVSKFIRDRVIELGFPESRTRVHYIGIDTGSIEPRRSSEEDAVILHVARLVEKKGTEYLIRAFAQVASKMSGVDLVIVGDGPLKGRLRSLAEAMGLGGRVHFQGWMSHSDVMRLTRKAAMVVLPSVTARTGDAEGLGMVLLEAAALGIPLIGTRHGGIPEVIIDGETGFLVSERDSNMLASRIEELLNDQAKRKRMGLLARTLAESRFDIRIQTQELEDIYDEILR